MPVTDEFDGHKFFTRIDAKRAATPLLAALVVVEFTDVDLRGRLGAGDPRRVAANRSSSSPRTRSRSSACGRCTSSSPAPRRGSTTCRTRSAGSCVFVGMKMTLSHWYPPQHVRVARRHPRDARRGDRVQRASQPVHAGCHDHRHVGRARPVRRPGPGDLNGCARRRRVQESVEPVWSARSRPGGRRGGRRPRRPGR